jgi:hypothetical protein
MSEEFEFDFRQVQESFLFPTAPRPNIEPTQPPIKLMPEIDSLEIKRLGLEADHSPQCSAEIKSDEAIPPLPRQSSRRGT